MKKVGIMVGREVTFPEALIKNVNERGKGDVVAEYVKLDGVRYDLEKQYDLVVDRISHEVPFYRATLKRFALEGTIIINNPFWWSADDKFFNYSLARKLGVAIPKTVLLPQKDYIEGITSESLRNLAFPLDWQGIIEYTGLPAFLKPFDGGGWKNVSRVNSLEELWAEYDQSGKLCMTLQESIDFDQFVRCYCIGQHDVMIMPYDPRKPYLSGEQYINDPNYLSIELTERVVNDVRTICKALGYDINTCEFAIKDGVPYAIDFMNPAPDAELASVGPFYHQWVTDAVTDLIFKRLEEPRPEHPQYRWDALLNPPAAASSNTVEAISSAAEQMARTIVPEPVREFGSDVVAGATEVVSGAANAVSELVQSITEPQAAPKPARSSSAKKENGQTAARKTAAKRSPAAPRTRKTTPEA